MWLEDHLGSGSMLQRNERVKLAASFWNNIGAGMVIGGMAAAFFLVFKLRFRAVSQRPFSKRWRFPIKTKKHGGPHCLSTRLFTRLPPRRARAASAALRGGAP
jgi:hypothetical protein